MEKALETVDRIERILESRAVGLPRVLHGTEATAWPMLDAAIARGHDVRIGMRR